MRRPLYRSRVLVFVFFLSPNKFVRDLLEFFLRSLGQLGFLLGWDWLDLIVLSFPLLGDLALHLGVTVLGLLSVTVGVYVLGLAWRKGKEGETLDLSFTGSS